MHSVLKQKDELNSLVEYEHKFYENMKSHISNLILKEDETSRESLSLKIPDKPCLQKARTSIEKSEKE